MNNNQVFTQSPKATFKATLIIHLALTGGQLLFALVAFFENSQTRFSNKGNNDALLYIVPAITVAGFIAGYFLYRQRLAAALNKNSLREKMADYQTAVIIRDALLEGPSLFAIVAYLLTGNLPYLIIPGSIILYFIYLRPTTDRMADDLSLSYEDKMEFDGAG